MHFVLLFLDCVKSTLYTIYVMLFRFVELCLTNGVDMYLE